jgi:hypothetical protein
MGFQTDLTTGFAQRLAAQGVGTWTADGAYTAGQTGIVLRSLPQAPDRVIVLTAYGVDDDPTLSDDTVGLQVTTRWGGSDPRPNDDLTDQVFDELQNLPRTTLATGVVVTKCYRRSWSSLGQDTNSRWRTSQNFYVTAHRPSQHRH